MTRSTPASGARAPGRASRVARLASLALPVSFGLPSSALGQGGGQELERARLMGERFLLIRNATVLDGTGGFPRRDAGILIRNGVIEFVGRVEDMSLPEGTEILDAEGGWLVPGFIDVHAHATDSSLVRALLAFGITTVRNPSSSVGDRVDYRRATRSGDIRGPRIYTAGSVIDAPPGQWPGATLVETEEEVRAAVRAQAEAGVDLVKLFVRLPPPLVAAAVEEAHALGLPVAGDLVATSWTEAARAGIDHLSRIVSRNPALLPPEARQSYMSDVEERRVHPYVRWLELIDIEGPEVDEMLGALLSRDVSVDPTLAMIESVLLCTDPEYVAEVSRHSPPADSAEASGSADDDCVAREWPADFLERARAAWPRALELVRLLYESGVRLTAGSDAPLGRLPAGASFHRELALLSEAGIPNREVLRIATANGAVALGILHRVGTLEPGKQADIVLLRGDPLEEIRNTREIEWVMLDAKLYRPSTREDSEEEKGAVGEGS